MVASHEVYSLFGGFFDYHQIMITPKDKYMTSFITNWGAFVWLVMAFGLKNNSINIPKVGKFGFFIINFGMFMKIFLYMILMFWSPKNTFKQIEKCWKFGISFNPKKCMFLVYSNVILGYIVSKEGKLLSPKKISTIVNMPLLETPKDIQVFNSMAQLYFCFIHNFAFILSWPQSLIKK